MSKKVKLMPKRSPFQAASRRMGKVLPESFREATRPTYMLWPEISSNATSTKLWMPKKSMPTKRSYTTRILPPSPESIHPLLLTPKLRESSPPAKRSCLNNLLLTPEESPVKDVYIDHILIPKGLPNLGNTCFFNSVLQCLLNTHHLKLYANEAAMTSEFCIPKCVLTVYDKVVNLEATKIPIEFNKNISFISVFKKFLTDFYSNRSLNPKPVFAQMIRVNSNFRGWQQQDAHEALRHLIDGLRQEELDAIDSCVKTFFQNEEIVVKRACMNFAKPVLDRVFGGTLLQAIRCLECTHISFRFEPFMDLSLPIPRKNYVALPLTEAYYFDDNENTHEDETNPAKAEKTIEAALKHFTSTEPLQNTNGYECEKCCVPINKEMGERYKTVSAEKKYHIHSLPPVLTLHLKRFEKTLRFGETYTSKIGSRVKFPLILDLFPYCSTHSEPINKGQSKVLYSLYSIVCHSGSLESGHYIAYVRSRKPIDQVEKFFKQASFFDAASIGDLQKYRDIQSEAAVKSNLDSEGMDEEEAIKSLNTYNWYYCSDSHVQSVSEMQVLGAEAFMLFYERFY